MDHVITSLSIGMKENHGINSIFTPFYIHTFSKLLSAKPQLFYSFFGKKSSRLDPETKNRLFSSYSTSVRDLTSPDIDIIRDDAYLGEANQACEQLLDLGLLSKAVIPIITCSCGIVNIPLEAYQANPKRYSVIEGSGDSLGCTCCKDCSVCQQEALVLSKEVFKVLGDFELSPNKLYQRKASEMLQELSEHDLVVSKLGDNLPQVTFDESQFLLDPDFYMLMLPIIENQNADRISIVAGHRQMARLIKSVALSKALNPSIDVDILLHPTVDMGIESLSTLSLSGFSDYQGLPQSLKKLLILMSFQWKRNQSSLTDQNLEAVRKNMSIAYNDPVQSELATFDGISSAIKKLNPQIIQQEMKKVRQGKESFVNQIIF